MAPSGKTADGRRKSAARPSLLVTLTVPASRLREAMLAGSLKGGSLKGGSLKGGSLKGGSLKDDTPSSKASAASNNVKNSPVNSANSAAPANSNGENASDSNAATPAAEGTPAPAVMGPPDGPKKKGSKRSAAAANGTGDGTPRARGKPGPKKKPRLDDGTIDHSNRPAGAHKLGPKANQGAINAGLRALDRSGKPCRKWARGGFVLKSFTGVVWEVSRWTAPPKKGPEPSNGDSGAPSADNSSSKENKENGAEANSASNSGADVEMRSIQSLNASSPAPMTATASS